MLQSILNLLSQHRRDDTLSDFSVLRAMLSYVDEFPEKRHLRKVTELLFPKLRARAPQAGPVLDQLNGEHASGEKSIQHLGHMLMGFEMVGKPRRQAFGQAAEGYVSFYLGHMELEEQNGLPVFETVLSNADSAAFDQAFAGNRDPLTGHEAVANYPALFTPIVNIVPAPVGLGHAMSLTTNRRPRVAPSFGALNDRGFVLQLSALA